MEKIRVLVADDKILFREGICLILGSQPDIQVIATADNGQMAVELVSSFRPDLVLMDIKMPVMNGITALTEIKTQFPQTVVLMLTAYDPDEFIIQAFRSGADGYLLKDLSGQCLAAAIRDAYQGNLTLPASIAARIIALIPLDVNKNSLLAYGLTPREIEIAELIGQGHHNDQIAHFLGISNGTVKNHISVIYDKLEVSSRQEAIVVITKLNNLHAE